MRSLPTLALFLAAALTARAGTIPSRSTAASTQPDSSFSQSLSNPDVFTAPLAAGSDAPILLLSSTNDSAPETGIPNPTSQPPTLFLLAGGVLAVRYIIRKRFHLA